MPSILSNQNRESRAGLALCSVGVIFGDLGTSPLYALKEVFGDGMPIDKLHIFGALSLIFWSLMLVVSTKYTIFIMRADNKGEGGIMALTTLALHSSKDNPKITSFILTIGLLGASLFYGDSILTPAISVLSAVEGLRIIAPPLADGVLPISILVLGGLFILQVNGAVKFSRMFSPVICLWFVTIGGLGAIHIFRHPEILMAVNPYYAVHMLIESEGKGFLIMGAVVLAITGVEVLYADMGYFGLKRIRIAWFGFVFPALLLNYFGQGALLLVHPVAIENPFYLLAPVWAMIPLLMLSTIASMIVSQAVIWGTFSVTRQAIQLGYCPRIKILHVSDDEKGQIYIPSVNWLLMLSVFVLMLSFQSSSALASAYGIAVTGMMIVDTVLAFIVIQALWRWKKAVSIAFLIVFLTLDFVFLASNSLKIHSGGWVPLAVAAGLFLMMTTWLKGRALLLEHMEEKHLLFEELEQKIKKNLVTVEGTAIYLARSLRGAPQVLLHNLEHNHVVHEQVIVMTIVTTDEPYVDEAHRVKIRAFGENRNFYRVKLYYGFKQHADVRRALELCNQEGLVFDPKKVSFFIGSERLSFRTRSPMPPWRRGLFRFLFHNTSSPIEFFKIPVDRVVELGIRIEL